VGGATVDCFAVDRGTGGVAMVVTAAATTMMRRMYG